MSTLKLLSQSEITAAIDQLGADLRNAEDRIHLYACSTLDHVAQHGDTNGAVRLMNALPKGTRVKGLAVWFKHFSNGKLTMKLGAEKVWVAELRKDRVFADFKVAEAMEVTFAELTEEPSYSMLTVDKFLKGIERTANNTANFDGTDIPKVSPEARAAAAAIVAFVRSQKKAA